MEVKLSKSRTCRCAIMAILKSYKNYKITIFTRFQTADQNGQPTSISTSQLSIWILRCRHILIIHPLFFIHHKASLEHHTS